jgi:hypothetical protein
VVIGAAPQHRFALHRRLASSLAPLLSIASLCIVDWRGGHIAILTGTQLPVNDAPDKDACPKPDL